MAVNRGGAREERERDVREGERKNGGVGEREICVRETRFFLVCQHFRETMTSAFRERESWMKGKVVRFLVSGGGTWMVGRR